MDTGIIISIIFGVASIISSICFGLVPSVRRAKIERLEKKVHTLAQDVDSFYAIEKSLLVQLSTATRKNIETLKKETRKRVSIEKGRVLSPYTKPSIIASEL